MRAEGGGAAVLGRRARTPRAGPASRFTKQRRTRWARKRLPTEPSGKAVKTFGAGSSTGAEPSGSGRRRTSTAIPASAPSAREYSWPFQQRVQVLRGGSSFLDDVTRFDVPRLTRAAADLLRHPLCSRCLARRPAIRLCTETCRGLHAEPKQLPVWLCTSRLVLCSASRGCPSTTCLGVKRDPGARAADIASASARRRSSSSARNVREHTFPPRQARHRALRSTRRQRAHAANQRAGFRDAYRVLVRQSSAT
jgi:hypothetical protein